MAGRRLVRYARRFAGLSQRELAQRSGVPQPSVARIEARRTMPRVDTLERLLRACGLQLDLARLAGEGVDRTAIRQLLSLSPAERLRQAVSEARNLERMTAWRRR
jgi:transcriptional regulator with XRE-family HTH domain